MRGFHQDAEGHWVAELSCGHSQHVRHQPPFTLRPWVLSEQGRAVKQRVESLTDDLAWSPYACLDAAELDELMAALEPLAALLVAAQN